MLVEIQEGRLKVLGLKPGLHAGSSLVVAAGVGDENPGHRSKPTRCAECSSSSREMGLLLDALRSVLALGRRQGEGK